MSRPAGKPWKLWLLASGVLVLLLVGSALLALQPWTANHFGYAVPGNDGLPTSVFANGRRYHSSQVCAGAEWCKVDQHNQSIPRCWTQADLQSRHTWPLVPVGTMFTLFGPSHPLLSTPGASGPTMPFIITDGPNCYVEYSLEGGP